MMNTQGSRRIAAAVGIAAVAVLGATTLTHVSAPAASVQARAKPMAQPTYVKPTIPKMQLGATENEPVPKDVH